MLRCNGQNGFEPQDLLLPICVDMVHGIQDMWIVMSRSLDDIAVLVSKSHSNMLAGISPRVPSTCAAFFDPVAVKDVLSTCPVCRLDRKTRSEERCSIRDIFF